jgi:glycosyltransferase involved in cell wall biosynthesis
MRIAVVSTPFVEVPPRRYGGTELIVASLARELVGRGHEVILYATGDSHIPGAEMRSLYPQAIWPPTIYDEISHATHAVQDILVEERRIDVVHANVAALLGFARFLEMPVVYTVHHDRDEALCRLYRHNQSSNLVMVAISERQRELLEPHCDARVVHHGLEVGRYPLGAGGEYAAFLGRFAKEKGVHAALDAATAAGVPLRLAGKPHWKDEPYFEAEVRPRLERPGMSWLGEADHPAKVQLLGGALATLFPIDWEEPFGLVMIESMLCGTPVLAFRRGSAAEVVDEGVTGWLVRDADEMAWQLARLRDQRAGFDRARCRAVAARRFSVARMADDYLALYQELATPALDQAGTS